MMTEDVRPRCIFCQQRYSLAPGQETPCTDPRTSWGHVEFWNSTAEQRDARFGPPATPPSEADFAEARNAAEPEPAQAPQMGFGL